MKLNVCCGKDYREGYVNIDFASHGSDGLPIKVDLVHDITTGLPYEDNSIDEIVFRESLEHFVRDFAPILLREFLRVLKPGAVLDLTVPPALQQMKLLMLAMQSAKNLSWEDFEQAHARWSVWKRHDDLLGATHIKSKGDSHLSLWSQPMLKMVLEHVGFKIQSIDDNIWVKAIKPL